MSSLEDDACIRCGKTLDHDKSKWLELAGSERNKGNE